MGKAYDGLKQYAEAEASLKSAITAYQQVWRLPDEPSEPYEPHYLLGYLYLEMGRKSDAQAEFEISKRLCAHPE
jgi:tetratricopeptide (TPR) repeat protein